MEDHKQDFYSIKNYKIKGNYYFRIGKNQYIKANNINAINGETLLIACRFYHKHKNF